MSIKEISQLLKNVQTVLDKNKVQQANSLLNDMLDNKVDNKRSRAVKFVAFVAKDKGVSYEELLNSKSNRDLTDAKHICYYMLKQYLKLTTREIAMMFSTWASSVHTGVKRIENLDDRIHADKVLINHLTYIKDELKKLKV